MACSSVVWRDDYGFTTLESLYILLEGKDQVLDDVIDVLVLMIHEQLLANPFAYKKRAIVTWPLALPMQKLQFTTDQAVYMMEDVMYDHKNAKIIMMPIVLNGNYHFLMLDMENEKYRHYSSLEQSVYDSDAVNMVSYSHMLFKDIPGFIYSLLMMGYVATVGSL